MKAFIALFAVAMAAAEPQFIYNAAPLTTFSNLAYTPYTYLAKPVEMKEEKMEEKTEEMKEMIKPVVYNSAFTYPYAFNYPYTTYAHAPLTYTAAPLKVAKVEPVPRYHAKVGDVEHKVYKRSAQFAYSAFPYTYSPYFYNPLVKVEKTEEEKPEEMKEIKPVVYNSAFTYPYAFNYPYTTYTHSVAAPLAYTAPVVAAKYEAIPRYQAKNGEVEHNVFKRSADADPALLYANAFHGYAASPFYPYAMNAYTSAYSAYPYSTYSAYNAAFSPYYRWY